MADLNYEQYQKRLKKYEDKDYTMSFPLATAVRFALEGKWKNEKPIPQPKHPRQRWMTMTALEWFGNGHHGSAGSLNWQILERHFAYHKTYPAKADTPPSEKPVPQETINQRLEGRDKTWHMSPTWCEWLMGWPLGWTSLDPLPQENIIHWIVGMTEGTWWTSDPADDPESGVLRMERKTPIRRDRIISLGNGQVPAQLVLAVHILNQL